MCEGDVTYLSSQDGPTTMFSIHRLSWLTSGTCRPLVKKWFCCCNNTRLMVPELLAVGEPHLHIFTHQKNPCKTKRKLSDWQTTRNWDWGVLDDGRLSACALDCAAAHSLLPFASVAEMGVSWMCRSWPFLRDLHCQCVFLLLCLLVDFFYFACE